MNENQDRGKQESKLKLIAQIIVAGLLASTLQACTSASGTSPEGLAAVGQPTPYIGNITYMTYGSGHGTQVEYLSADGHTSLWYPGNSVVLHGDWKQDTLTGGGNICFRYNGNTYNPVTGQSGGGWECTVKSRSAMRIVEKLKGDSFGLAKRSAVPFNLSPARTSFADLMKQRH